MSSHEPLDVGPIVGGHLPAGPADRARATQVLHEAHASGYLADDELQRRLSAVAIAPTVDDLIPLTRGLVGLPDRRAERTGLAPMTATVPMAPHAANLPAVRVDPAGAVARDESITTIFGGAERTGFWRLRQRTNAFVMFGGQVLDLTEVVFDADECVIDVSALFGGIEIRVPAGVNVVSDLTAGVFGGVEVKGLEEAPNGPTVRIRGFALFGGIEVKGPRALDKD